MSYGPYDMAHVTTEVVVPESPNPGHNPIIKALGKTYLSIITRDWNNSRHPSQSYAPSTQLIAGNDIKPSWRKAKQDANARDLLAEETFFQGEPLVPNQSFVVIHGRIVRGPLSLRPTWPRIEPSQLIPNPINIFPNRIPYSDRNIIKVLCPRSEKVEAINTT